MTPADDPATPQEQDEADRLDAAIDALLADHSVGSSSDAASLEDTAGLLASSLPRLHPRFGFEERLVHRLRDAAGGLHLSDQDRAWATVLAFPVSEPDDDGPETTERSWRLGRRSLIGALASAASLALTLAGAVVVVLWRRARGGDSSEAIA